jgi:riboflavin synthase
MFTGLIEGQGVVREIRQEDAGVRLEIRVPTEFADDGKLGDSIAINGCCLTVVDLQDGVWGFQAGPETLAKTTLGQLAAGHCVNLERSLPADGRLGGHFVQGHVDGVGQVAKIEADGEWITIWFSAPPALTRQMVSKGSIAVEGVSLTLVDVETDRFSVALIPHTLDVTTLGKKQVGDGVNLETDIIGKYMDKMLSRFR